MELSKLKEEYNQLKNNLNQIGSHFDIDSKLNEIKILNQNFKRRKLSRS